MKSIRLLLIAAVAMSLTAFGQFRQPPKPLPQNHHYVQPLRPLPPPPPKPLPPPPKPLPPPPPPPLPPPPPPPPPKPQPPPPPPPPPKPLPPPPPPPAPISWMSQKFGRELMVAGRPGPRLRTEDVVSRKIVGIYFSAHWCPPCRLFTPRLVQFHRDVVSRGLNFEIVFVSNDRNEGEMFKYMQETGMAWGVIPFESPFRQQIQREYNVTGIPTLIILDEFGRIITTDGRGDVERFGFDAFKHWERKAHHRP